MSLVAYAVPVGLGALFAAVGGGGLVRDRRLRVSGAQASGVIVAQHANVEVGAGEGGGLEQRPVVEFTTRAGRPMRCTSRVGTNQSSFLPGRRVIVDYDPANPEHFSIRGRGTGVYRLFLAIGLAILLGCAAFALAPNPGAVLDKLPLGIPLLLGIIFAGVGWYGVHRTWRIKHGGQADGVVVGATKSRTRNGLTLHHPLVRYPGPDGNLIDTPSIRGRLARPPQPGTRVRVHYDLADPQRMLLSYDGTPATFWIFGVAGVLVFVIGVVIVAAVLAG